MKKVFGLFLKDNILAVISEDIFVSKSNKELEDTIVSLIPEKIKSDIEMFSGFRIDLDKETMSCSIFADNGMLDIDFKELTVIS